MCNLYKLAKSQDEVADFFRAITANLRVAPQGNLPEEVYPGYPGLVLAGDNLQQMVWGFPLQRTGAKGQLLKPKPVNNTRSDKLGSPFWSASFRQRRCLIPVSAFAEAEGPQGSKTRTWFAPAEDALFAMAGIWRDSAEWGGAYSMLMTEANDTVRPVHSRMPVILAQSDWNGWLHDQPEQALRLCKPWSGSITVKRTDIPWAGRR